MAQALLGGGAVENMSALVIIGVDSGAPRGNRRRRGHEGGQGQRLCPESCAKAVWPVAGSVSVGCLHGVTESGHVQVAAARPIVGGDVSDPGADEHERAPAVGEAADDPGAPADLPVEAFDHVVRADPPPVLRGILVEQIGRGLADTFPQAGGRRFQSPGLHLAGDLPGLGEGGRA